MSQDESIAEAIEYAVRGSFMSPNVADSNGEPANVVDALDAIGRSLRQLASGTSSDISTIEAHGKCIEDAAGTVADGLHAIAKAIDGLAKTYRDRS